VRTSGWIVSTVALPAMSRQPELDRRGLAALTLSFTYYQALYAVPLATA
jgi:hypothetical protein